MILYADSSALAKRYLSEPDSKAVESLIRGADVVGSSIITRAEVSAALAKAVRMNWLAHATGERILKSFRQYWLDVAALPINDTLVAEADALAWHYGLRGYDAVHLASALLWRTALGEQIVLATFDRQLWDGAKQAGLDVWPVTPT